MLIQYLRNVLSKIMYTYAFQLSFLSNTHSYFPKFSMTYPFIQLQQIVQLSPPTLN